MRDGMREEDKKERGDEWDWKIRGGDKKSERGRWRGSHL